MEDNRLVFISGLPRSGTHLLRFALEKSPDVSFVPETTILYKYWGSRTLRFFFGNKFVARMLSTEIVTNHGDPSMADFVDREHHVATAALSRPSLRNTESLLRALAGSQAIYIGEKSPNNALFLYSALKSWNALDDVYIVWLDRNPYDQIASSIHTKHIGGGVVEAIARNFLYREAMSRVPVLKIAYEELVLKPREILSKVCKYLEIEFCEEMLKPGILDSSTQENSFQRGDFGFITESVGRGRTKLSRSDEETIDRYLRSGPAGLLLQQRMIFWYRIFMLRRNQMFARLGIVLLKKALGSRFSRHANQNIRTGKKRA